MSLTQGALLSICQGKNVESPNLQIISVKKIAGNGSDRYRLLLSDGIYSNSYAMLASQLSNLVADNTIDEFCVIRANQLQCNDMQGKKVIIILDLDILRSGAQVGQRLGTPIPINSDGTINENDRQKAMAFNSGRRAGKRTGDEPAQQPVAKKPLQAVNNRPSMLNTSSNGDSNNIGNVYPIASLTPYQNKWTIKARVTHKSDIRRWSNSRGEGHLFSMDLVDESGEIRATAFKEQCDKYYNMIEVGKVYYITHGSLKAANRAYSTLNNEYELTFRDTTEVTPCTEDTSSIPTLSFDFCQIGQLNAGLKDNTVDIIGICKSAGDATTITSQRTQKELRKRDVVLVDKSLAEINLTLWGTTADNFDPSGNPVVAIKGAKVSDYNGVSLSSLPTSVIQINPDLPQGHELKGWYEAEGSTAQTSSLTTVGGSKAGGDFGSNVKTLGDVKKENLGMNSDKGEYYSTVASVTLFQKDKALYKACSVVKDGKSCNKKVQDQGNGMYRCEKCKLETDTFNWRLILSFSVADPTDNLWVNCFQETGEQILGVTSEELGAMQNQDKASYDRIFSAATFKKFNFRLRCKSDFYNDEPRVRHTVISVGPVNYIDYNKRMIRELEEAGIPMPAGLNKSKYM